MSGVDDHRDWARQLVADWPPLNDEQQAVLSGAAAEVNAARDRAKPRQNRRTVEAGEKAA